MTKLQKLELTWIGKDNQPKLEPRILIEDPEKSYVDGPQSITPEDFENLMKEVGAVARAIGRDI